MNSNTKNEENVKKNTPKTGLKLNTIIIYPV